MSNDFLNLIEKDMFKVDSGGRISAILLQQRIKMILAKGEGDTDYLLGTNGKVIDSFSGMKP